MCVLSSKRALMSCTANQTYNRKTHRHSCYEGFGGECINTHAHIHTPRAGSLNKTAHECYSPSVQRSSYTLQLFQSRGSREEIRHAAQDHMLTSSSRKIILTAVKD